MSSMKSVIITLPKELSKTFPNELSFNNAWAPKLNFATSILSDKTTRMDSAIRKVVTTKEEEARDVKPAETSVRGKKRRLDHLTWEEKLQRKKLKNRVAAQTSRDRKKAKLDELEETVRTLRERTEQLTQQCTMLSSQNEKLMTENKRLRSEIDVVRDQQQQYCSLCQSRVGCAVPSTGSAVSINPLPQGGTAQPASCLTMTPGAAVLLKIMTFCLLWKSYSEISRETTVKNSKNWPKALCKKFPPKWKQILRDQMNKQPLRTIPLSNLNIQMQWWGRHQKMWKPVEPVKA